MTDKLECIAVVTCESKQSFAKIYVFILYVTTSETEIKKF